MSNSKTFSSPSFQATAPSNIALIKYMGKQDFKENIPSNSSLSMSLNGFCSHAKIEFYPSHENEITPSSEMLESWSASDLSRMKLHLDRVLSLTPEIRSSVTPGFFLERTALSSGIRFFCENTFPAKAGIASSASSFAAMTLAAIKSLTNLDFNFDEEWNKNSTLRSAVAHLSSKGSGSSCRSFEGPFVAWECQKGIRKLNSSLSPLTDLVLLVSRKPKKVGSSEAHRRAMTSTLWPGRIERATHRFAAIEKALIESDRRLIAEVVWAEFFDMHSLFHTAQESFSYWTDVTTQILKQAESWMKSDFPPIITMDAGPNIHMMVPTEEALDWERRLSDSFPQLEVLSDTQGLGAR